LSKKIQYLKIIFDSEIKSFEIPALRGAIIAKVGQDKSLFHNHIDDKKLVYSYPLIQYKSINNKASIVCIDEGTEEMESYFTIKKRSIELSGRTLEMKVESLVLEPFELKISDRQFDYTINQWIALNQEGYQNYRKMESLVEKITFLQKKLVGNILSFAKGIEWKIEQEIKLSIISLEEPKWCNLKGQKVLAFDCKFKSNVLLPNYIGLGKSVSLGFGVIKEIR